MKLQTKQFRSALSECGRVIKGKLTLPALGCVKLSTTNNDQLQMETTNCDAWITQRVYCAGGIEPVMVSHSLLTSVLEGITEETVTVTAVNGKLTVKSKSFSKLNVMAGDFLSAPDSNGKDLAVVASDLADGLSAVNWAAERDSDAEAYKLTTVIDLKPKALICVATTGNLMAKFERLLICETRKFTLPSALIRFLIPALRGLNAHASMSNNLFTVRHDYGGASIKFTEREPFLYEGVSSQRGDALGTMVDRASLLRACHLSIVFTSKDKHAAVEMRRDGDILILSCAGEHGVDENSIEAPGDDVTAKVSAEKLSSALGKLNEEKVRLIATPNAVFIESGEMLMVVGQLR